MRPPGAEHGHIRLMVLVNNGVGSDGEYMQAMLASLPEAGYSVLPQTRLPFRIALGTSDVYGDNRSSDSPSL